MRLVPDFKDVNRVLKSPNYPNEGSDAHLKQIDPSAQVFCTMDFSHGYYQVEIDKRDCDLFSFLVPKGKCRFCRQIEMPNKTQKPPASSKAPN